MKIKTNYPRIFLKPGREKALQHGHPWIFSGAIASVEGKPAPGDVVAAADATGKFLGVGFYNPNSDITFRLLTKKVEDRLDDSFWKKRIKFALALRQQLVPADKTTAYRIINAEGDIMPGLVVDRYDDYLVCSIATAGMEKIREIIFDGLQEACQSRGIYERSEGRARKIEGFKERIGWIYGELEEGKRIPILENDLHFEVDIISGQKTGFFLDQRINREALAGFCNGMTILNCFSYTGAFSVYAAKGGAQRVVSVDVSEGANALAKFHLGKNGFSTDRHPVIRADVFSWLREMEDVFDAIILDPPAFAKSRKDVVRSARGYKDINMHAMKHLRDGGLLWTFSCSNFMDEALFQKVVLGAAQDAGRNIQLLKILGPGPDHPTSLAHLEGRYLKGLLLRVFQ